MDRLSQQEIDALKAMADYKAPYPHKVASCYKLVAKGLASSIGGMKKHRPTQAGYDYLTKLSGES